MLGRKSEIQLQIDKYLLEYQTFSGCVSKCSSSDPDSSKSAVSLKFNLSSLSIRGAVLLFLQLVFTFQMMPYYPQCQCVSNLHIQQQGTHNIINRRMIITRRMRDPSSIPVIILCSILSQHDRTRQTDEQTFVFIISFSRKHYSTSLTSKSSICSLHLKYQSVPFFH